MLGDGETFAESVVMECILNSCDQCTLMSLFDFPKMHDNMAGSNNNRSQTYLSQQRLKYSLKYFFFKNAMTATYFATAM